MIVALVVLVAVVFLLPFAAAALRGRDPWGPGADQPVGYQLTDTGLDVTVHPSGYVLDEDTETWGPA